MKYRKSPYRAIGKGFVNVVYNEMKRLLVLGVTLSSAIGGVIGLTLRKVNQIINSTNIK